MKKNWIRCGVGVGVIWLLGLFFIIGCLKDDPASVNRISFSKNALAKSSSDIQKEIDKKNEEIQSAEEEKKKLERDIAGIEKKKGDTLGYIKELDEKSNELAEKIYKNQNNIIELKKQIKKLRKEKKKAEQLKKKQYATMKKRIKYMYENGSTGYVELLLGAKDLSDFFNRAEYVSKVTAFDKKLLAGYKKNCRLITSAKKKIEQNLTGLEKTRSSLQVEEASVESLVDKKRTEVAEYQNLIQDKNGELGDTEVLLGAQENELEKLFEAEREASAREEAEREAALKEIERKKKEEKEKKKEEEQKQEKDKKEAEQEQEKDKKEAEEQTKEKDKKEEEQKQEKDKKEAEEQTKEKDKKDEETTAAEKPKATEKPVVETEPPAQQQSSGGGYQWPLASSGKISSYFGSRNAPTEGASSYHKGIDISVPVGTAVLAAKAGTVTSASYSSSMGNYVSISHGEGAYSYYMHCSSLSVKAGQSVNAGQQIALSGNSGISTGPHLHFGLYIGGSYVNPLNYLN